LTLFSVKYEGDKPVEQEVQSWDVSRQTKTAPGHSKLKVPVAGQFRISVKISDSEGHEMEGGYVLFVRGPADNGSGYRFQRSRIDHRKEGVSAGRKGPLQINTNKARQHSICCLCDR
jgi:hypothetical protein